MRKFTTIFVAVVLCLAALAVCASAAEWTDCPLNGDGQHDWTAWRTVDNTGLQKRTCACGAEDTRMPEPEHVHNIAYVPAAEACHVEGTAEYWYCTDPTCEAVYADEALTQLTNRKNLAIAPDAELAYVPAAEACHVAGTAEYWYCPECDAVYADAEGTQLTNRKNLEIPADCELAYVPAAEACHVAGISEYWYCPECDAVYADAEGTQLTNRKNLEIPADTELVHHEAIAPCHANGYLEYWYCPDCDAYFADAEGKQLTNIKNLTVEGDLSKLVYTAKVEPTATENGMNEYWYCAGCDCYFTDAEGKMNIAYLSLTIPATGEAEHVHTLEHFAEVPACHNNGMAEHWYCAGCDCYFTDAEGKYNIARLSLTTLGDLSKLEYHAAVEATATENGMKEYWYCAGCDCFFTDAEGKYNIAYLSLTIPATGEGTAPSTGDASIFFVVAIVAVATLGVAAVSFKKREN